MTANGYEPVSLKKIGGDAFQVEWSDGRVTRYPARRLRQACRCAGCRDEITGRRTLDPSSVSEAVRIETASLVGNYAVGFTFSDGHQTGIYSFDLLRSLSDDLRTQAETPADRT